MSKHDSYPDALIRRILAETRTIALVGASAKPERPSHGVMRFLQRQGYRVIPVNPGLAGKTLHGEKVYARIADIPERIDMVDIFRNSAHAGAASDDGVKAGARFIWMQLGVSDPAAAERAEKAGLTVIMNRCPAIEIPRLGLERRG
jgi:predicted CoA-binding protein